MLKAPLQYPGQARYDITPISHHSDTFIVSDHTYTLPRAKQVMDSVGHVSGVADDFYDVSDVPKAVSGSVLIAAGGGLKFWANENQITIIG